MGDASKDETMQSNYTRTVDYRRCCNARGAFLYEEERAPRNLVIDSHFKVLILQLADLQQIRRSLR